MGNLRPLLACTVSENKSSALHTITQHNQRVCMRQTERRKNQKSRLKANIDCHVMHIKKPPYLRVCAQYGCIAMGKLRCMLRNQL